MGAVFRWVKYIYEWCKAFSTQVLGAIKAGTTGVGTVYFVHGFNGDDTNDGLTRDKPFLTIRHALDQCVADHDDYIMVLDCWQQETFPISIDVSRVHIIGVDKENGKLPRMNAPTDTAIFTLDADYCEIANLSLNGGVGHAAIEIGSLVGDAGGRGAIRGCWFGVTGAGLYGIYVPATFDAPEMLIEKCRFGIGLTSDGIQVAGNMTRSVIKKCLFRAGAIGINVPSHMNNGWILSNRFVCSSVLAGTAITLTNTDSIFVDDNRAQIGKTAMGVIPYVDGGTNHWGVNYQDIVAVLPA